ncbi:MAG: hypothetical protein ABSB35_28090 [Bryobacteraceae bacterium]
MNELVDDIADIVREQRAEAAVFLVPLEHAYEHERVTDFLRAVNVAHGGQERVCIGAVVGCASADVLLVEVQEVVRDQPVGKRRLVMHVIRLARSQYKRRGGRPLQERRELHAQRVTMRCRDFVNAVEDVELIGIRRVQDVGGRVLEEQRS